jgi:CO/xanthine dehydrogenase FAD-binding subunit
MVNIEYHAPQTIAEAVKLLAGADKPAKVLAGGTDLIIQLGARVNEPHLVVDSKHIPELMDAALGDDGLALGPSLSSWELSKREDIKAAYPGLVEAAFLIGSTQVQGRCSVGGNLCNSSPAADTIPALFVIGAQCQITGPGGVRTVAVEDFVTGVGQNCMDKGELLTLITAPRPAPNTSSAYLRFIPRTEMDIAVAGAGVSVTLDADGTCTAARVSIGAVAPTALLVAAAADALIGSKLEDAALDAAAQASTDASSPITDRRGTVEYRRHVVGVLTKRAAKIAGDRAKEG